MYKKVLYNIKKKNEGGVGGGQVGVGLAGGGGQGGCE